MKKNKSLLFDMVCNLDNYAFKINLKEKILPIFIKQYSIIKSIPISFFLTRKKLSGIVNLNNIKLCLDFKEVNVITKLLQYIIFVIKEIFIKIEGKRYLTKLNIKSAFYYILLIEKSH
jgi:hypothetical protein